MPCAHSVQMSTWLTDAAHRSGRAASACYSEQSRPLPCVSAEQQAAMNTLNETGAAVLARSVQGCCTLESVELRGVVLGPGGFKSLLRALAERTVPLKCVLMSCWWNGQATVPMQELQEGAHVLLESQCQQILLWPVQACRPHDGP